MALLSAPPTLGRPGRAVRLTLPRQARLEVVLAASLIAYLLAILVAGEQRDVIASAGVFLGQAACGVALLVRRPGDAPALRRVWLLAGASFLSSSGIFAVWTYYAYRYGTLPPFPSLADALFLGAVLLMLGAAIAWPTAPRRGAERWRYLVDGAVGTLSLLLLWVVLLGQGVFSGTATDLSAATVVTLAFPIFDLLAVAAALFAVSSALAGTRRGAAWLLASVSTFVVSDGIFVTQLAADAWSYGSVTMVLWLVAPGLLVLGRARGSSRRLTSGRTTSGRSVLTAAVPVLPVAGAFIVAIASPSTVGTIFGVLLVMALTVRHVVIRVSDQRLVDDLQTDALTEAAFLQATLEHLSDPVLAVDADGRIRFFNDAFKAIRPHVAVGDLAGPAGPDDVFYDESGRLLPADELPLVRALRGEDVRDHALVSVNGKPGLDGLRVLSASARQIVTSNARGQRTIAGAVLVSPDITESRQADLRLLQQALTDELTGLGNRTYFDHELRAVLAAQEPSTVAVLLLDLDDFKNVNDSLGHATGDELLVEVAARVSDVLRAGDHAARLGGDEFVLLIQDTDEDGAMNVAERLLMSLELPVAVGELELNVSASVGLVMCDVASDPANAVGAADLAMYLAKQRGKGGIAVFESHLQEAAQARLALENDLRRAVRNGELHLVYQPIVDLASGALVGVEALVRWEDSQRGFVSPVDFIPIAEDSGLILPLGEWVLCEAVAQLDRWNAAYPETRLVVSVNVSSRQLERRGLLSCVDGLLEQGLDPGQLVIEITETALGLDDAAAMQTLHALRDRGIHLAVDDFGTGYSSLGRLRAAPVSRLKIDRSFVSEIVHGGSDVPIVDATMAMSRGLGLGVVAEGIETTAQLEYLQRLGCAQGQGYLLARPLAPDAVADILAGAVPWAETMASTTAVARNDARHLSHLVQLAVASEIDLEQLVRPLLDDLQRLTRVRSTYLTRLSPDGSQQRIEFTNAGAQPGIVEGVTVAWENSLCKRSLARGIPRSNDAAADFADTNIADELGIVSYLAEPLYDTQGQLYGTLCGASDRDVQLTETDSATARLFARLVSEKLRLVTQVPGGDRTAPASSPAAGLEFGRRADLTRRRDVALSRWMSARAQYLTEDASHSALAAATDAQDEVSRRRILRRQAHDVLIRRSMEPAAGDDLDLSLLRVMVADDDGVVRAVIGSIVEQDPVLVLVAEAHTGAATIGIAIAEQPDLLVLDYDLGDMDAMHVIPELRQFAPATRIVLHSGRDDVHEVGQRLGVDRAVRKLDGPQRLREALESLTIGLASGG